MSRTTVAAIDLGASSGRVIAGHFEHGHAVLQEVHRFRNVPVRVGGVLRWDVLRLFRGIVEGLRVAGEREGRIDSIGVDGWAVDYALLDGDGQLLGNPAHYRDPRTGPAFARALTTIGADTLYGATGTQLQPFNTVFQLMTEVGSARLAAAEHLLLIPDLMTYWLGGSMETELTNASTTGLLDARTLAWSDELATRTGAPLELFAPVRGPGRLTGPMRADVAGDAGLTGLPQIVTVPSHDTAAAVAGIPASGDRFAYVCTGTWALVGLELPAPVISDEAREENFTNEIGAGGTVRFLRNVTGFWLLQECVREWRDEGVTVDLDELTRAAAVLPALQGIIDVQDPGFAAPGDMPRRVAAACLRTSGVSLASPAQIVRCILDSMALAVRHAIQAALRLADRSVDVVHVVGGGVSNNLFCQLVADACGLPVLAGPTEAASWGNALTQAAALGIVGSSLDDTRALVRAATEPVAYLPAPDEPAWRRADDLVAGAGAVRS